LPGGPLVTVDISGEEGFVLRVRTETGEWETRLKKKRFHRCPGGGFPDGDDSGLATEDYDYPGLYSEMVRLKNSGAVGDLNRVTVTADDEVPWEVLVGTVDAVRVRLERPRYEDRCAFEEAGCVRRKATDGDGRKSVVKAPLFEQIFLGFSNSTPPQ